MSNPTTAMSNPTIADKTPQVPTDAPAVGIAALGLHFPSLSLPMEELAALRGQDPKKYTLGLGCREMALCPSVAESADPAAVDLAVGAALRALRHWAGREVDEDVLDRIGLIAVGTESAADMSRPLSAWVAQRLGLSGAVRSYEVKHACYGGTLALRQAVEWKLSGASRGKAALVIATDVALYEVRDPGEPTQGAGAVAMVVDEPRIAAIDPVSFPWSEPAFDFWRPVGEAHPRVDGPLSLDCYKRAAESCFHDLVEHGGSIEQFEAVCYHVPFPKMVKKAVVHVGESLGWDEGRIQNFFADKVDPHMEWNRDSGNSYTASLWIAVARALAGMEAGQRVAAFSYGSGFGAELLSLTAGPVAAEGAWAADVDKDLSSRRRINATEYAALRGETAAAIAA